MQEDYKKTSKSFQMPISSVVVNGNHRGGDKVWKTNKTSRGNCLLGSYKSQLKPEFDQRRSPRRFGRLELCYTVQLFNHTSRDMEESSENSVSEVWKRTLDQGWCFFGSKHKTFWKNVEVEENGFHKWVRTPNRPQNPPEPPQEAKAGFTMALTLLTMDRPPVPLA